MGIGWISRAFGPLFWATSSRGREMTDTGFRHTYFDIFSRPDPLGISRLYVDNDSLQKLYRNNALDWLKLTGHQIVINEEVRIELERNMLYDPSETRAIQKWIEKYENVGIVSLPTAQEQGRVLLTGDHAGEYSIREAIAQLPAGSDVIAVTDDRGFAFEALPNASGAPVLSTRYFMSSLLVGGAITPWEYFTAINSSLTNANAGMLQKNFQGPGYNDTASSIQPGQPLGIFQGGQHVATINYFGFEFLASIGPSQIVTADGQEASFLPWMRRGIRDGTIYYPPESDSILGWLFDAEGAVLARLPPGFDLTGVEIDGSAETVKFDISGSADGMSAAFHYSHAQGLAATVGTALQEIDAYLNTTFSFNDITNAFDIGATSLDFGDFDHDLGIVAPGLALSMTTPVVSPVPADALPSGFSAFEAGADEATWLSFVDRETGAVVRQIGIGADPAADPADLFAATVLLDRTYGADVNGAPGFSDAFIAGGVTVATGSSPVAGVYVVNDAAAAEADDPDVITGGDGEDHWLPFLVEPRTILGLEVSGVRCT